MCIVQRLASVVNPSSNGVSVLAVCPGFCQSDLSRGHQGIAASILRGLLNTLILRTTEQGARTLVSGAVLGPEVSWEVLVGRRASPDVSIRNNRLVIL
jgi:hypothetical protein